VWGPLQRSFFEESLVRDLSWQGCQQRVYLCDGIVEMGRNAQAICARRANDIAAP
jgi:hypothetical protein